MSKIKKNMLELIGNTPLMEATKFCDETIINAGNFLVKLEFLNPAGSIKDRVALQMIEDAERDGILKAGATIIEPTSGNTGIGLAAIGTFKGYNVILTLPETMSVERRMMLASYGAKLELTSGKLGMKGAIQKAEELHKQIKDSVILGQFENPSNPKAHELTTGPEIWQDTDGMIDIFVATVGTGGTLSGTAKYLKEKNPQIQIVAVEPEESAVLSGKPAGIHGIQGIGAGFIPKTMDMTICDQIVTVFTDDAIETAKEFGKKEGILVGISSGAALAAAKKIALLPENKGKTMVTILPDSGDRYLSVLGEANKRKKDE